MIVFDLQCSNGHIFEGWFESRNAYEEQKGKGLISCPVCNDTVVSIIPSTFAIKNASHSSKEIADQKIIFSDITKKIAGFVEKNFEDVGSNFAREALKMHYGIVEPKNITGSSTKQEEKILKKEGIHFFKIPLPTPSDTDA